MNKIKIFLVLVAFLLIPLVNAGDTEEITTLNYLETSPEILYGDVTLSFNWSERDNHSDIIPVKLSYNSTFDYTFYMFESKNISGTVGASFVNNTKGYYFTSGGNDYVIYVDYSDFRSPLWNLEQLIKELNNTIADLQLEIARITSKNEYNHSLAETLNSELNGKRRDLEQKISEYNTLSGQVALIELDRDTALNSYNETWEKYNATVFAKNELEWDLYYKNLSMEALTNPFSITYPKQGIDIVQFNAIWFFLGGGLFVGAYILFTRRPDWNNMKQGSILQKLPFARTEQKKSQEWNMAETAPEEVPDIEKRYLKPPDTGKKLESSMEKIKEEKTNGSQPEPVNVEPVPVKMEPTPEPVADPDAKAKGNQKYWNSPAGIERKKELAERARSWHKKDKN